MEKVIFLDIDGVIAIREDLNEVNKGLRNNYSKYVYQGTIQDNLYLTWTYCNYDKIRNLLWIAQSTGAEVIATSSYADQGEWPYVAERLRNYGLSVSPHILTSHDRAIAILDYVKECNVDTYVILDDSIFVGYRKLVDHLVWTNNYDKDGGLTYEKAEEAIYILNRTN